MCQIAFEYLMAAQHRLQRTGLRPEGAGRLGWQSLWFAKVSCQPRPAADAAPLGGFASNASRNALEGW
jgi:hypothetical protein